MIKGVDISHHQGGLTMEAVKKAGFQFAILRGGYTGYGSGRQKVKDGQFERFYAEAKKIGMPVGCYWYSCARTQAEGIAEANFLYENCLKGKQFEYPIYIDVENNQWQASNAKGVTDAIIGFCETLEAKGYWVGIYANTYWFTSKIQTNRLNAYTKWVARWSATKPSFPWNAFDIWQNSDNGSAGGRRVDTNISYKDFPSIIKAAGKNGFKKTPTPAKKSVDEIAQEVIKGAWGNGSERKKKLAEAGYSYDAVQEAVNNLLKEKTYTVQKGDTLTAIAKKFDTTVDALVKKNGIKDKNLIYAGQVIKI